MRDIWPHFGKKKDGYLTYIKINKIFFFNDLQNATPLTFSERFTRKCAQSYSTMQNLEQRSILIFFHICTMEKWQFLLFFRTLRRPTNNRRTKIQSSHLYKFAQRYFSVQTTWTERTFVFLLSIVYQNIIEIGKITIFAGFVLKIGQKQKFKNLLQSSFRIP